MKMIYTTGRFTFEQDGVDRKAAFELASVLDELFGEEKCGLCGGTHIRHQVTHPGEYTYYKLKCMSPECGATLDFGQNKDMKGLFVKKWDAESKRPLDNGGWYIWDGRQQDGGGQQTHSQQRVHQPSQGGQGRPQQQPAKQDDGGDIPF